jgi:PAS domain S-box-containing protein
MKIRTKIIGFTTITIFIISVALATYYYFSESARELEYVDSKLFLWAEYARKTLPENYHDVITDSSSVSKERYNRIVEKNNLRCREMDLQYIWSVLVLDPETIVFTTATSPGHDIHNDDHAGFFQVHGDPGAFREALETMEPSFSSFHNEWGHGRMVLVPEVDSKGRTFMFGASTNIDELVAGQRRILLIAILISLLILAGGIIFSIFLSLIISRPLTKFAVVAGRIQGGDLDAKVDIKGSDEEKALSNAINVMTGSIKRSISDLAAKEKEGKRYKDLMEVMEYGVYRYRWDDAVIISCNNGFVRLLDLDCSPGDLAGKAMSEVMIYTEKAGTVRDAVKNGETHNFEYHFKTLKGEDRWVMHDSYLLSDPETGEKTVEAIVKDITGRKKSEEELRRSEHEKALILNNANEVIAYHDTDHNLQWANKAYLDSTGLKLEEIKGKKCYHAWGLDRICNGCPVSKAIAGEKAEWAELTPKNQPHWPQDQGFWMVSAAPLKDAGGNVIGAIEIAHDITERKKSEEELDKYREHLEELVEERTKELDDSRSKLLISEKLAALGKLAGITAHELRNPLGVIRNAAYFLGTILSKDGNEKVRKYLNIIEEEVDASDRVISDILVYGGIKDPIVSDFDVKSAIRYSLKKMKFPDNVVLEDAMGEDVLSIAADKNQLAHVFTNLVTNALHAMPDGGKLTIMAGEENGNVVLRFKDTGVGIPNKDLDLIFSPGFSSRPHGEGAGLGLAVCQSIARLHGGTIDVISETGKGSEFTVTLPPQPGGKKKEG